MISETWARGVLAHRGKVLAVGAIVTLAAAPLLLNIRFDETLTSWFPEGDPAAAVYQDLVDTFDTDELSAVAIFADDVINQDTLRAVTTLTHDIEALPHVQSVLSLANARVVEATDDGVAITPVMDGIPRSTAELSSLRARITRHKERLQGLVSADHRTTALVIELTVSGRDFFAKEELLERVESVLDVHRTRGVDLAFAGTVPLDATFMRYTKRDALLLGPLTLLLVLLAGLLVFRRVIPLVGILVVVLPTLTLLYGLMAGSGLPVDMVTSSLGTVVLTLGVADTFHVVSAFYEGLRQGDAPVDAAREALLFTLVPCFFTSFTTAAGLLALTTSPLHPIANFGLLAGVGVVLAFFFSVTCLPALLAYIPSGLARPPSRPVLQGLLGLCTSLSTKRPMAVVFGAVVIGVACSVGLWQLEVGTSRADYFLEGDPVLADTTRVDTALGGTANLEYFLTAKDFTEPAALAALRAIQTRVSAVPGVRHVASLLGPLDDIHQAMSTGTDALPEVTRALVAQYLLILEGDPRLGKLIDAPRQHARITARLSFSDVLSVTQHLPDVAEISDPSGMKAQATGLVHLMAGMKDALLRSQVTSFLWAFLVVTITLCLLLRSVRLGLLAMLPNLLPIVATLGVMGLLGTPLDPATVMVASIAIGLVVDDTVHFLLAFRTQREIPTRDAVTQTLFTVGPPIVATSLVLLAGYLALFAGSFRPTHNFAVVTITIVVLALVADLVVLPALFCLTWAKERVVGKSDGGLS